MLSPLVAAPPQSLRRPRHCRAAYPSKAVAELLRRSNDDASGTTGGVIPGLVGGGVGVALGVGVPDGVASGVGVGEDVGPAPISARAAKASKMPLAGFQLGSRSSSADSTWKQGESTMNTQTFQGLRRF